jgi:thymidylate kinase
VFRYLDRRRLGGGGAIIAVVGGDGSGKSTAVEGLHEWLAPVFETQTVHMGKPGWSASTIVVLGLLKAARVLHVLPHESRGGPVRGASVHDSLRFTDYVRRSLTARDRYLAYRRVRRGADEGSLVIADRFPLPQITLMDGGAGLTPGEGAGIASRWLAGMANSYYARMRSPEVLIVLRVDPGIAVRRKTEENEVSVRARTTEIWNLDWSGTHAQVVDASQSREDVLRIVKDRVWSSL